MYCDDKEYLDFLRRYNIKLTNCQLDNFDLATYPALNPNQDWTRIGEDFRTKGIVVIDDFLNTDIAVKLRDFMLLYNHLEDIYKDYAAENFLREPGRVWFPELLGIVNESIKYIPTLHNSNFQRAWSFIYENISEGVSIHADPASININLWVTNDSSIIHAKDHNGLSIWRVKPPADWDHDRYNKNQTLSESYIDSQRDVEKIDVEYKFNRAIMFNSMYFHKTQPVQTIDGYENRRINYTFLFDNSN
jgi:hypothetical protein